MGVLRRLAFFLGFILGLATIAVAGIVALTYLFTGKFPSVEMSTGKPAVQLMTPDQVVDLVREQVDKAKAARAAKGEGGKGDVEA